MRCKFIPVLLAALAAVTAACGDGDGDSAAGTVAGDARGDGSRPTIVVTTSILGDVVGNLVGDRATVEVLMPPGAAPHEYQLSARQVAAMREADVLVVNGAGFEATLEDAIEAARSDGVPTYEAISAVDLLRRDAADGDAVDPHFFTDPRRMGAAAHGIVDFLAQRLPPPGDGADGPGAAGGASGTAAWHDGAAPYLDRLRALDAEVERMLAAVPPTRRKLVTNHDVFGYFAERYGFEVIGVVIPGGGTQAAPSPAELEELASAIRAAGGPAVFADTSSPRRLAETLAGEVGEVDVVELYSESLGPPGSAGATYLDLVRTNAGRIAGALAGGPLEAAAR